MTAPYQNIANGLASLGRYEDTYIVHAAEGETVIPKEVLASNPKLKEDIFKQMRAVGINQPESYIVGDALNSRNPVTGQPEFFFKSLKKFLPTIGAIVGNILLPGVGGAIGSGLGSLAAGQSIEQSLINAGLSYVGGKYVAPEIDKAISGFSGGSGVATLGSTFADGAKYIPSAAAGAGGSALGSGTGGFVSQALSGAGATIPQVLTAGLTPALGQQVMKLAEAPQLEGGGGVGGPSIVDEYYAAKARGEDPPLPPELTPPPTESLVAQEKQGAPTDPNSLLANIDYEALLNNVLARKMFLNAANGGYITGPGTATSDSIPTRLSNTEFVQTGKAVAGADPTGGNNPDQGAKVMAGIMRAFEQRADQNARSA